MPITLRIFTPNGPFPGSPITEITDLITIIGNGEIQIKPGHKKLITTIRGYLCYLQGEVVEEDVEGEEPVVESRESDSDVENGSPPVDACRRGYKVLFISRGFAMLDKDVLTVLVDSAGFSRDETDATLVSNQLHVSWA
ncbi:hypothetical protein JW905_09120 [bacterium]|nr:hypothetical protein [candidate division CSSED10-310 bacterium]